MLTGMELAAELIKRNALQEAQAAAKNFAKEQRAGLGKEDTSAIKVMFAENQLLAEEQLLAYREKPIVMEHEK